MQVWAFVVAILTAGCVPFGDCWPQIEVQVRRDRATEQEPNGSLVVAGLVQFETQTPIKLDPQELPVSPEDWSEFGRRPLQRGHLEEKISFRGYPYPIWYVAFVDQNENRRLDPGESFGTYSENPLDRFCEPSAIQIDINSVRSNERF